MVEAIAGVAVAVGHLLVAVVATAAELVGAAFHALGEVVWSLAEGAADRTPDDPALTGRPAGRDGISQLPRFPR